MVTAKSSTHADTGGGEGRGSMETNLTLVSARQSADLPAPPSPINNSIVHVYKGADYKYSIQMTVFIPAADHKATFLLLRYHRHDQSTGAGTMGTRRPPR